MTVGGTATSELTSALCPSPAETAIWFATSALPVAVNVTGLPVRLPEVAVSEFDPAVVPSFHDVTFAMPVASVVSIALTTLPPPEATANVTIAPAAALLNWSRAITLGAVATFVLTVAVWPLPALSASCVAAPAVPVAVKVTGRPVNPADVAVSVFDPAVVPSVHDPTVAIPPPLVGCEPPATLPPPVATANVTVTPATALPHESLPARAAAGATLTLTRARC